MDFPLLQSAAGAERAELASEADGPDGDTLPQFKVTNATKITDIALQTQNYDDDGSLNGTAIRQMTGLATLGVMRSDPRVPREVSGMGSGAPSGVSVIKI